MSSPWLLVDASWLAHRSRHALGEVLTEDIEAGIIFGVLEQLRTVCSDPRIRSNKLALFFDSRKSVRRREWPAYKAGRHKDVTPEERAQIEATHAALGRLWGDIFPRMGVPVYRQTGLESDDLMAYIAKNLPYSERAFLITADSDLWQCISLLVTWFDPCRNVMMDTVEFWKKKGIEPQHWGRVKAVAGCKTDGVPGVPGVGEATAIEYILHRLPARLKRAQAIGCEKGVMTIARNERLVVLPHERTKPFELSLPRFNPMVFFHICEELGIHSYLKEPKHSEWIKLFRGYSSLQQVARKRGQSRTTVR
jgi:5'-3' exonuclease, N-terminal resolvase-like domain